jgi:hypothetical protein
MPLNHRRSQRGQGIVEFAVIFPLFAALLFIIIDGGLALGVYNNVNNSAKEGARLSAVGANASEIVARAKDQAHGRLDGASTDCATFDSFDGHVICVEWISGPTGEPPGSLGASVRVKIKYKYGFLTPLPNFGTFDHMDLKVCAVQRQEQAVSVPSGSSVAGEDSC